MNHPFAVHCAGLLTAFVLTVATAAGADDSGGQAVREMQAQLALALQGNVDSQYRIGEMYEQGIGVPRDTAMAYLWYNKAARQGDARARDRIAALDKARDGDSKERERVNAAVRALQQQSEQEAVARQSTREKEKAAAEARARRQAEQEAAARREREKAAAEATAARARAETPAKSAVVTPPAPVTTTAPALSVEAKAVEPVKPAMVPKPTQSKEADSAEFSADPCKGPQARFRSICNM